MLTAALAIARRLPWRYIGPAIGAALALWAAYDWAWQRGHDSRNPEVALLIRERDAAKANVATLEAAVVRQNAAVAEAAAKGKAAQDTAAGAVRMAQEREKRLAGVKGRLDAATRAVPAQDGCAVPDAVRDWWRVM